MTTNEAVDTLRVHANEQRDEIAKQQETIDELKVMLRQFVEYVDARPVRDPFHLTLHAAKEMLR